MYSSLKGSVCLQHLTVVSQGSLSNATRAVYTTHRVAALVERMVPHLFPPWHSRTEYALLARADTTSSTTSSSSASSFIPTRRSLMRKRGGRRTPEHPTVAYFGPHHRHERMLRQSGVDVQGLDYFAPGRRRVVHATFGYWLNFRLNRPWYNTGSIRSAIGCVSDKETN